MKRGDKIKCVRAGEPGIPIKEGETYTVGRTFEGNQRFDGACAPGMESTPGVELEEFPGDYFTQDRFEVVK